MLSCFEVGVEYIDGVVLVCCLGFFVRTATLF